MKRTLLWLLWLLPAAVALFVILGFVVRLYNRSQYPYGWSHCCLKGLGLALQNYAEKHNGRFPAGAGCPEASLSLLYREGYLDAETLRGKTVPVEKVKSILERGELLGPDSCGWHYVEGLTTSDDPHLAIVWDKVGLDHNGRDLNGGHSVWFLGLGDEVVPASDWPQFLECQQELLADRPTNAKTGKSGWLSVQPKLRSTLECGGSPVSVAFSPDGKTLSSGCLDTTISVQSSATEHLISCQNYGFLHNFVQFFLFLPQTRLIEGGMGHKYRWERGFVC